MSPAEGPAPFPTKVPHTPVKRAAILGDERAVRTAPGGVFGVVSRQPSTRQGCADATMGRRHKGGNRVSICPHCQAENEAGAKSCRACGKPLAAASAGGDLPLWLQALNPEGTAEDTVVAQTHTAAPPEQARAEVTATKKAPAAEVAPHTENEQDRQIANDRATPAQAARPGTEASKTAPVIADTKATASAPPARPAMPADTAGESPSFATPTAPTGGTDTVIATKPTAAARPGGPAPATTPTNETASLISEDDLPAWLRAFSEPENNGTGATDDDQTWMLGSSSTISDEQEASDLAQSWQAPARATAVERTSAAAIFAAPTANPTNVTRHERLITPLAPPPVVVQPAAAPPKGGAATDAPVRLGAGRPIPASTVRVSSAVQRVAIIAFIAALLIFLVVLAIFVVAPALRG